MYSMGVLGLSVARSEIDKFVQKDSNQTINTIISWHKDALHFLQGILFFRVALG